jgi:hypothetical protein
VPTADEEWIYALIAKRRSSEMAMKDCYCALCRTPRVIRYSRNLQPLHYGQIVLLTVALTWIFFSWFAFKTLGVFFLIWALYELALKMLYRRDLKCKVCGFDPTWYKRDVKIARKQVQEYLANNPNFEHSRRKAIDEMFNP